jgi:hypothetical protein
LLGVIANGFKARRNAPYAYAYAYNYSYTPEKKQTAATIAPLADAPPNGGSVRADSAGQAAMNQYNGAQPRQATLTLTGAPIGSSRDRVLWPASGHRHKLLGICGEVDIYPWVC